MNRWPIAYFGLTCTPSRHAAMPTMYKSIPATPKNHSQSISVNKVMMGYSIQLRMWMGTSARVKWQSGRAKLTKCWGHRWFVWFCAGRRAGKGHTVWSAWCSCPPNEMHLPCCLGLVGAIAIYDAQMCDGRHGKHQLFPNNMVLMKQRFIVWTVVFGSGEQKYNRIKWLISK